MAVGQNHRKRIPCEPTHLFPIKVLIEELDSEVFWQIHRGTVVNLRAIAKVIRKTDGRPWIRLRDCPEILEVSRSYSGLLRGM
jgi:DNA-binding LytR/AlgR family response regulator